MKKRLLCLFLVSVVTASAAYGTGFALASEYEGKGVVAVNSAVYAYSGPGAEYTKTGRLESGDSVNIVGTGIDANGETWYRVTGAGAGGGYVRSAYIDLRTAANGDSAFEQALNLQGFPESYRVFLRSLHTKYPNWTFNSQKINIDFNTAVDEESKDTRSLVQSDAKDSWKSMEQGSYDWATRQYNTYSGGWIKASREIIAYYLDPRNFLDEQHVFQFECQSYSANHTKEGVAALLSGTFMAGDYTCPDTGETRGYADTFLEAAKKSGVSAYHLASRARLEQGTNGSPLSLGTVPGYANIFNFFNIGANGGTGGEVLKNGAAYAAEKDESSYRPWTNQYKSIMGGAAFIAEKYIAVGQDTPYLEKWDVVDGGNGFYGHQYMQAVHAPASEAVSNYKGYGTMLGTIPFVFKIPVYGNMPAAASPKPSDTGNNDNTLNSLAVSGYTLTPTFGRYILNYELVVDGGTDAVTVTAERSDADAVVDGTGVCLLKVGNNTVNVTVTASSGVKRVYTIKIVRKAVVPGETPPSFSGGYRVGDYITGVKPGTGVGAFLAELGVKNGTARLYNSAGKEKSGGTVATGDAVRVYAGSKLMLTREVLIYGDLNGDGIISVPDGVALTQHFLGIRTRSGVYKSACDTDRSGNVSVVDRVRMQKYFLGTGSIEQ